MMDVDIHVNHLCQKVGEIFQLSFIHNRWISGSKIGFLCFRPAIPKRIKSDVKFQLNFQYFLSTAFD